MELLLTLAGLAWLAYLVHLDRKAFNTQYPEDPTPTVEQSRHMIKQLEQELLESMLSKPQSDLTPHTAETSPQRQYELATLPKRPFNREMYLDYIQSTEWRKKAESIKYRDKNTCQSCGLTSDLQVHHITYANLYVERDKDLITICRMCHAELHQYHGKNAINYPLIKSYHPL